MVANVCRRHFQNRFGMTVLATVEVWKRSGNFISHFTERAITYPC